MAKLVAMGDSLAQGFQNGAIHRTDWSFPAMIARSMGINIPTGFRIPTFPGSGLPFNIEQALRGMAIRLGPDISPLEWLFRFPGLLSHFMDEVEDLYERGAGSRPASFGGVYHNLAVWGFRVADSFTVTSALSEQAIDDAEGWIEDDFLGLPSAPMYRVARRILNPRLRPERTQWTMLDNVQQLMTEDGSVENLILWLGSNDALGTVLDLEVREMPSNNVPQDPRQRRQWNLTHPDIFAQDYAELVEQLSAILPAETQVFVANVGHVTIPPVTQGIPPFRDGYFQYYGRFFVNQGNFSTWLNQHLTRAEAQHIDETIDAFNTTIHDTVEAQGDNWHLVDIAAVLDSLAVKRNEYLDAPGRALREFYAERGISDHPLLHLSPIPSSLLLETHEMGQRIAGGLFSLDCFHPTTIGYGIVAEEFLRVMQAAGVPDADPARLNWTEVIGHDTLLQQPPVLWDDILEAAANHSTLWDVIFRVL